MKHFWRAVLGNGALPRNFCVVRLPGLADKKEGTKSIVTNAIIFSPEPIRDEI